MSATKMKFPMRWLALSAFCVPLFACGGGGGGGGGSASTPSSNVPTSTSGTATLSWIAPTTRMDGSPLKLSELGGYKIYEGTSLNDFTMVADLGDPSQTNYTISNLPSGTHYFAVTVYDSAGTESAYSSIAQKTVN